MNTIEIVEVESDVIDCECCGCFSVAEFSVEINLDGVKSEYSHYYDGHFGGGDWNGDDRGRWLLILTDITQTHYLNYEDKHSTWSVGVRDDVPSNCSLDYVDEFLDLSPDKVVNLIIDDDYNTVTISLDKNLNEIVINIPSDITEKDEYFYDGGSTSNIVRYAVIQYAKQNNFTFIGEES